MKMGEGPRGIRLIFAVTSTSSLASLIFCFSRIPTTSKELQVASKTSYKSEAFMPTLSLADDISTAWLVESTPINVWSPAHLTFAFAMLNPPYNLLNCKE
jgi:hypothetical protein